MTGRRRSLREALHVFGSHGAGVGLDPEEISEFWKTSNPAVTRLHCPLLASFGTRGDVGTEEDFKLLESSIQRHSSGPSRVDTIMIQNAGHMYVGQESQVAQTIAQWIETHLPQEASKPSR